jgi:hypothetical protein
MNKMKWCQLLTASALLASGVLVTRSAGAVSTWCCRNLTGFSNGSYALWGNYAYANTGSSSSWAIGSGNTLYTNKGDNNYKVVTGMAETTGESFICASCDYANDGSSAYNTNCAGGQEVYSDGENGTCP